MRASILRLLALCLTLASPAAALAVGDLAITDISGPAEVYTGADATVSFTIDNVGDAPVTAYDWRLFLSDNRVITKRDELVSSGSRTGLTDVLGDTVTVTATIPTTLVDGLYHFGVIIDAADGTVEDNRANNARASFATVSVRAPAPDLTPSEVRVPSVGAAGESIPVSFTLENRGNMPADFTYGIYLSHNEVVSSDDVLLFEATRSLAPSGLGTQSEYVRLAPGLPPGEYTLGVIADPLGAVAELDEGNNVAASAGVLTVEAASLTLATTFVPEVYVGADFTWQFVARGGTGAYTFAIASGSLPTGVSLDPVTGILSGRVDQPGLWPFVLEAKSGTMSALLGYSLAVIAPTVGLTIQTEKPAPAVIQELYAARLSAVGGTRPYTWSAATRLPDGLTLDPNGTISGSPRVLGEQVLRVAVADIRGEVAEKSLVLEVLDRNALTLTTGLLPVANVREPYLSAFEGEGGEAPYVYTLVGGRLPPGVALDAHAGVLTGDPLEAGRFTFQVQVRDSTGLFDTNAYTITVGAQPVSIVTRELSGATVEEPYEQVLNVLPTSGTAPFTWHLASGVLPAGITLDAEVGLLSGTPEIYGAGVWPLLIEVFDSAGAVGRRPFVLVVEDPERTALMQENPVGEGCATGTGVAGPLAWVLVLGLVLGLRRRRAALLCLLLLAPVGAQAQTWNYSVSQQSETYVPLTGGNVVTFGSTDSDEVNLTMPFPITFYGTAYTTLGVTTNGVIVFGGATTNYTSNYGIPDPSSPNGHLSVWWDDLYGPNGEVTWHLEGSAPNRVFVVQYTQWQRWSGRSLYDMQARFFEASSVIKVNYGDVTIQGTESSATVGIEAPDGLSGVEALGCSPNCTEASWPTQQSITYSTLPDLSVSEVVAPTLVYGSVPMQVRARVTNVGGQGAGAFRVVATLSDDDILDAGDTRLVGEGTATGLDPGESTEVAFVAELPASLAPDRGYFIFVEVNDDRAVAEAGYANNVAPPQLVRVGPAVANLRAEAFAVATRDLAPGDSVAVSWDASNTGAVDATAGYRVVLSRNTVISVEDTPLSTGTITLAAGASSAESETVTLPSDVPSGRYRLGVVLDPDGDIAEPDEADNVAGDDQDTVIHAADLVLLTTGLPAAKVGRPYQAFLEAAGGDGGYTWTVTGGLLPAGVSLSPAGQVSGVPDGSGSFTLTVSCRSAGLTATGDVTLVVDADDTPLTIVTLDLPEATFGAEYESVLYAAGGTRPYDWRLVGGALPAGLSLHPSGQVIGLAIEGGDFRLTVEVADDAGATVRRTLNLSVVAPGNLLVVTMRVPVGELGAEYSTQLSAAGGSPPYRWSLGDTGRLPAGLTLRADGLLSGTPEEVGDFDVVVQVADDRGRRDTNTLALTVRPDQGVVITTRILPVATYGVAYTAPLSAVGGTAPYRWALVGGELPGGLTIDENAGVVLGTPVGSDIDVYAPFAVEVIDAAGRSDLTALAVQVGPAPPVQAETGCSATGGRGEVLLGFLLLLILPWRRRRA